MNSQRVGLRTGGLLFGLVCLAHLWRIFAHVPVQVGSTMVAMWVSVFGAILSGTLSVWFLTLSKR